MNDDALLTAAVEYAGRGLRVFPVHYIDSNGACSCGNACNSPGKHPITKDGSMAATDEPSRVPIVQIIVKHLVLLRGDV